MSKKSNILATIFVVFTLILSVGCGRSGQLLGDLPVPDENKDIPKDETPTTTTVGNNQFTCNPDQSPGENNIVSVDGCTIASPTLDGAKTAFFKGDFVEANCQASLVFNESVKVDPNKPENHAAFIAFSSRLFLLVESDDGAYFLLDDEHKYKATEIFGPNGDLEKFSQSISEKYEATIKDMQPPPEDPNNLYVFAKTHLDRGRSIDQIVDRVAGLFNRVGPDLHTLAKSMAHDAHLGIALDFPNNEMDSEEFLFNSSTAALIDMYLTGAQATTTLATHYHSGIKTADVFINDTVAVKELNADPKTLSLRGSADASEVIPMVSAALSATLHAAIQVHSPDFWAQDFNFFLPSPKSIGNAEANSNVTDIQAESFKWVSILLELQSSLGNKLVAITATEGAVTVNLQQFLKNLPNANDLGFPIFILDENGGMELNGDAMQAYYNKEKAKYPYIEIKE